MRRYDPPPMPTRDATARRLLPAVVSLAVAASACAGPPPTQRERRPPERPPVTRAVAPPRDPAPPTEPAFPRPAGRSTLTILSPEPGARVASRSLVVAGLAPSGARVILDGPLFLDRTATADAWGAWWMPLTLDPGPHELRFTLASGGPERRLAIAVDPAAEAAAPSVAWPPDGAVVPELEVTLRGMAAPGAPVRVSTDDVAGAIGRALGAATSATADAGGRWSAVVPLAPGQNRLAIAVAERVTVHALVHDPAAPGPAGLAPELAVRSTRILPFEDRETGRAAQVVLEVENVSDGWVDLLGGRRPPGVSITPRDDGPPRSISLAAFPRRVAPGHTALLLGELRAEHLEGTGSNAVSAEELSPSLDVSYAEASPPSERGRVETYRLDVVAGDGVRVSGRFRGGSTEPRFQVAILGYDAAGSLIGFAVSAPRVPGTYEACCLPLVDAHERARLARVVGVVTTAG